MKVVIRALIACTRCHNLKKRCAGGVPCERCRKKNLVCSLVCENNNNNNENSSNGEKGSCLLVATQIEGGCSSSTNAHHEGCKVEEMAIGAAGNKPKAAGGAAVEKNSARTEKINNNNFSSSNRNSKGNNASGDTKVVTKRRDKGGLVGSKHPGSEIDADDEEYLPRSKKIDSQKFAQGEQQQQQKPQQLSSVPRASNEGGMTLPPPPRPLAATASSARSATNTTLYIAPPSSGDFKSSSSKNNNNNKRKVSSSLGDKVSTATPSTVVDYGQDKTFFPNPAVMQQEKQQTLASIQDNNKKKQQVQQGPVPRVFSTKKRGGDSTNYHPSASASSAPAPVDEERMGAVMQSALFFVLFGEEEVVFPFGFSFVERFFSTLREDKKKQMSGSTEGLLHREIASFMDHIAAAFGAQGMLRGMMNSVKNSTTEANDDSRGRRVICELDNFLRVFCLPRIRSLSQSMFQFMMVEGINIADAFAMASLLFMPEDRSLAAHFASTAASLVRSGLVRPASTLASSSSSTTWLKELEDKAAIAKKEFGLLLFLTDSKTFEEKSATRDRMVEDLFDLVQRQEEEAAAGSVQAGDSILHHLFSEIVMLCFAELEEEWGTLFLGGVVNNNNNSNSKNSRVGPNGFSWFWQSLQDAAAQSKQSKSKITSQVQQQQQQQQQQLQVQERPAKRPAHLLPIASLSSAPRSTAVAVPSHSTKNNYESGMDDDDDDDDDKASISLTDNEDSSSGNGATPTMARRKRPAFFNSEDPFAAAVSGEDVYWNESDFVPTQEEDKQAKVAALRHHQHRQAAAAAAAAAPTTLPPRPSPPKESISCYRMSTTTEHGETAPMMMMMMGPSGEPHIPNNLDSTESLLHMWPLSYGDKMIQHHDKSDVMAIPTSAPATVAVLPHSGVFAAAAAAASDSLPLSAAFDHPLHHQQQQQQHYNNNNNAMFGPSNRLNSYESLVSEESNLTCRLTMSDSTPSPLSVMDGPFPSSSSYWESYSQLQLLPQSQQQQQQQAASTISPPRHHLTVEQAELLLSLLGYAKNLPSTSFSVAWEKAIVIGGLEVLIHFASNNFAEMLSLAIPLSRMEQPRSMKASSSSSPNGKHSLPLHVNPLLVPFLHLLRESVGPFRSMSHDAADASIRFQQMISQLSSA